MYKPSDQGVNGSGTGMFRHEAGKIEKEPDSGNMRSVWRVSNNEFAAATRYP